MDLTPFQRLIQNYYEEFVCINGIAPFSIVLSNLNGTDNFKIAIATS